MSYGHPPPARESRTGLIVTLSVVGGVGVLLALGALIAVSLGSVTSSNRSKPPSAEATKDGAFGEGGASEAPSESSETPSESPEAPSGPSAAEDAGDAGAEGDVRITGCELDAVIRWPTAEVEIVNHSGARASYIVSVEFVDGDGTRHAEGLASASRLDAGQKSLEKAQRLGKFPGKVTCRIAKVSRYPAP